MSLATTLAGVQLEHPLMNAAGTCKTLEDVQKFARSAVSAITVGSITVEARSGNAGNVYYKDPQLRYALNSLGMPNRGSDYYREQLPAMVLTAHAAGKPLAVSVAGFSAHEYGMLAGIAAAAGVDLIELNLGCPNVWSGGEQKPIASFDPRYMTDIIGEAYAVSASVPIGIKLSPFSDPYQLAEVVRQSLGPNAPISYVVACNTFPNGFEPKPGGKSMIDVGLAGMSGAALKPIALGQVRQLLAALPERVQLVGAGGIAKGYDIASYLEAGAVAVQAATVYWNAGEDPGVYGDVLQDIDDPEGA